MVVKQQEYSTLAQVSSVDIRPGQERPPPSRMQNAPGTDSHGGPQLQLPSVWHTQSQGSPSAHEKLHEQLAAYPPAIEISGTIGTERPAGPFRHATGSGWAVSPAGVGSPTGQTSAPAASWLHGTSASASLGIKLGGLPPFWQLPSTQVGADPGQTSPQPPQLFGSFWRFSHVSPRKPPGHAVVPAAHGPQVHEQSEP